MWPRNEGSRWGLGMHEASRCGLEMRVVGVDWQ